MEILTTHTTETLISPQQIQLIDGTFSAKDAADIINSVLDVKINYHKLKRLSIMEGNADDHCEFDSGRINELLEVKANAKVFFNALKNSNKKLNISAIISIEEMD